MNSVCVCMLLYVYLCVCVSMCIIIMSSEEEVTNLRAWGGAWRVGERKGGGK